MLLRKTKTTLLPIILLLKPSFARKTFLLTGNTVYFSAVFAPLWSDHHKIKGTLRCFSPGNQKWRMMGGGEAEAFGSEPQFRDGIVALWVSVEDGTRGGGMESSVRSCATVGCLFLSPQQWEGGRGVATRWREHGCVRWRSLLLRSVPMGGAAPLALRPNLVWASDSSGGAHQECPPWPQLVNSTRLLFVDVTMEHLLCLLPLCAIKEPDISRFLCASMSASLGGIMNLYLS